PQNALRRHIVETAPGCRVALGRTSQIGRASGLTPVVARISFSVPDTVNEVKLTRPCQVAARRTGWRTVLPLRHGVRIRARNREAPVKLSIWFQELKRRRVFRALVTYAIVAFAILQVIEPVMHGLALPEWLLKAVVIGLGLGLPVTLLLAWAYDISPQGIERTPSPAGASVKPSARAYRALVLGGVGLLLAPPAVLYYLVRGERSTAVVFSSAGATAASVAVLPFVNMSDDPSNDYF